MKLLGAVLLLFALLGACSRPDDRRLTSLISGSGVAGIHLCDSLADVSQVFPDARDTVLHGEGEGAGWPSKIVPLEVGEALVFETSWSDTIHVWRITTTSARFRTRSGLHVGSTMADVYATGNTVAFKYPEGILYITLDRDSVGLLVDDSSAAGFWRRFSDTADPRAVLNPDARIKTLGIGGNCAATKAAA
jgi:hypothetical protein